MNSVIEAQGLTKAYGSSKNRVEVLHEVTVAIAPGESIAIVGKSGSGKSTLMHQLALLDTPTAGGVLVDGHDARNLKQRQLDILRNQKFGFVFQQFFLNGNDTVLNNVMLPLKIAGTSRAERKARALESLKAVDLADKANEKAVNLSGGQKQRVCIARALINKPQIIFADEPTGNLDTTTGDKVTELLFKLNKEQGITLIIVTHDLDLARKCDRQVVLKDGQIIKDIHR